MQNPTLELAKQLISQRSVTPDDALCQTIMAERLENLGFNIEHMPFGEGTERVANLWARRGTAEPLLVFAGHTDVVPAGDLAGWNTDPFIPIEKNGVLYGRGAADMKSSLAAFITAIEDFVSQHPDHAGSIALLITSDEEGIAKYGTVKVIETLQARQEEIDYCIVGEPSSTNVLGDVIKNGRRGSLGCVLTLNGKQGHVAYPHLANNPIHYCGTVIEKLTAIEWDQGNKYFPPTSFQISNINSGTGATNVIPGSAILTFNFRFSTEITDEHIRSTVESLLTRTLENTGITYETDWHLSGQPFITGHGELVNACVNAIKSELNIETKLSTAGGTSDGRFIAPTGAEVVELGPVNASIHQINENVEIEALQGLSNTYRAVLENLLLES
ncbi:MAG: succinyl-diaminopimelate desuccinylase [Arenicella sp.]